MNEVSTFPFDALLADYLEESKLKRFRKKVTDKRSELDGRDSNS